MDKYAVATPGTDEWWVARLAQRLAYRVPRSRELKAWLDGEPPVPFPDNHKPGFQQLQEMARINVASLIVDARLHRMQVLGAKTKLDDSANGDDVVARMFEEQDLKRKFHELCRYMLGLSAGYAVVTGDGTIRVSGPENTIAEQDAEGKTIAALSLYRDENANRDVMILARPGYTRTAYREGRTMLPGARWWQMNPGSWDLEPPVANGADEIPVYEFRPIDGKSLLEKHLPTLARINHGVLQRLILIAMQAFRQRGLKNAPVEDEDGEPIDYDGLFESSPDALWLLPEGVDVWESGQADMTPVLSAVKDDLRFLAVESKTPLFMISPDDANGSAEGATTQREILTFDVEAQLAVMEGNLKRLLAAALRARGETERADLSAFKLIVANPRRSSITERASASAQALGAGIPFKVVMEKLMEMDPDELEEALQAKADDAFLEVAKGEVTGAGHGGNADVGGDAGEGGQADS